MSKNTNPPSVPKPRDDETQYEGKYPKEEIRLPQPIPNEIGALLHDIWQANQDVMAIDNELLESKTMVNQLAAKREDALRLWKELSEQLNVKLTGTASPMSN